ncbi:MAG: DNA-binding domain-containing protein [Methylacidiphilales bacterium]|nr:DNA-binding domain-containing protein [Candidatus Methylacidiphilales bacterium]
MKRSKPRNSSKTTRRPSRPEIKSRAQLLKFQRLMATALFRPLTANSRMQTRWMDGRKTADVVAGFVKPNDRLSSFDRLEIYNRQYWFRILDCFYEDYPGLRAALGERSFMRLAEAYLKKYPSASFTLRNLGSRLEKFLREQPKWAGKKLALALDIARFEWAQVVAFDGEARPPLGTDELLDLDPAKAQLSLQPYITFLALDYPIDNFVLAVKKHEALRGEASNAMDSAPKAAKLNNVPLPKREKIFVAVHRHENALYYKRLEPEAFVLLNSLRKGASLETACRRALRGASPQVDWQSKIKEWFQNWSALGWFCQAP